MYFCKLKLVKKNVNSHDCLHLIFIVLILKVPYLMAQFEELYKL